MPDIDTDDHTMNLILFTADELDEGHRLVLRDRRFQHIRNTHGACTGDRVRVGQVGGLMGTGELLYIDDSRAELTVDLTTPPPPKIPLTILLALPRPKMLRRILRTSAELGISELHLINSAKVEKSYWQSPALDPANIHSYLIDGLQQARDTVLPVVRLHRLFKPFVEDTLPQIAADTVKLVAHPATGKPCPAEFDTGITLAIGPEGGFTDYEVTKFLEAGFEGIHLGMRILRVENAVTALASRLYSV